MPFDVRRFERYAMHAETMIQKAPATANGVNVYEVGDALGIDREDSLLFARMMVEEGWASGSLGNVAPTLKLKLEGYRRIAKLRWPSWRRWIDNHPKIVGGIIGYIAALASPLILELLKRLLYP